MDSRQKIVTVLLGGALALLMFFHWHQEGNSPVFNNSTKSGEIVVLLLTETDLEDDYPIEQQASFRSTKIDKYLDSHCYKIGGTPAWRRWDNDTDYSDESQIFQDIMNSEKVKALADEDMPYVVISNGKNNGVGQPWPEKLEDGLALLKKWGGE